MKRTSLLREKAVHEKTRKYFTRRKLRIGCWLCVVANGELLDSDIKVFSWSEPLMLFDLP
jgi:hypothetical protein